MSLIILNLRHYNTPALEGIVQPSSNTGYEADRLSNHQHHNRNRYWFRHPPEPAPGDRGGRDPDRRGHVNREEGLRMAPPGRTGQRVLHRRVLSVPFLQEVLNND